MAADGKWPVEKLTCISPSNILGYKECLCLEDGSLVCHHSTVVQLEFPPERSKRVEAEHCRHAREEGVDEVERQKKAQIHQFTDPLAS